MGRIAHLIVFARAPMLGTVKRRLAADIGPLAARRFYAGATNGLLHRVARDRRWQCWLAVTPDRFAVRGRFWGRGVSYLPQGPGGLGRRMARALGRFPASKVVIVGSDIPDIGPGHIAAAFRALGSSDVVLGPAGDGGYWLIGLSNGCAARPDMFKGVRWSTPDALKDTIAGLGRRRIALLEELNDVDTGADLERRRTEKKS